MRRAIQHQIGGFPIPQPTRHHAGIGGLQRHCPPGTRREGRRDILGRGCNRAGPQHPQGRGLSEHGHGQGKGCQ